MTLSISPMASPLVSPVSVASSRASTTSSTYIPSDADDDEDYRDEVQDSQLTSEEEQGCSTQSQDRTIDYEEEGKGGESIYLSNRCFKLRRLGEVDFVDFVDWEKFFF